ncbi:transcription factor MYC2 [Vigna unguiculata]|uniref:Transcription factor MYC2 n=1 Tax=Vigna unguiculata TaxID=3917 RepID=A0A4D6MTK6_VIGUN|nr:transcription factor MYC2 [Vigna unguiculata]
MDESWEKWFSNLEMGDDEFHVFNEHDMMISLEEELMKGESSVPHDSDSAINNDNGTGSCLETNTQHANSSSEKNQVFSSCTFSFADSTVVSNVADESFHAKTEKRRSNLQAQQHIMAEKKRREKLSTMFLELSTMEMDDDELHLFNEHNMNSLEEELMKGESSVPYDSYFANSSSSNNNMGNGSCLERNTQHANSNSEKNQMVTPCNLSFEDSTVVSNVPDESFHAKPEKRRSISQTSKHIMAERKRREKISTLLIELSAMLPGLKKMDKISIISKTIDYVKYLQNRINDLQEVNSKRESMKYCKNNNTNVNISENSNDLDTTFLKIDSSVSECL